MSSNEAKRLFCLAWRFSVLCVAQSSPSDRSSRPQPLFGNVTQLLRSQSTSHFSTAKSAHENKTFNICRTERRGELNSVFSVPLCFIAFPARRCPFSKFVERPMSLPRWGQGDFVWLPLVWFVGKWIHINAMIAGLRDPTNGQSVLPRTSPTNDCNEDRNSDRKTEDRRR